MRALIRTTALVSILGMLSLTGCAVSLFSDVAPQDEESDRILRMEQRLDRIEQQLDSQS